MRWRCLNLRTLLGSPCHCECMGKGRRADRSEMLASVSRLLRACQAARMRETGRRSRFGIRRMGVTVDSARRASRLGDRCPEQTVYRQHRSRLAFLALLASLSAVSGCSILFNHPPEITLVSPLAPCAGCACEPRNVWYAFAVSDSEGDSMTVNLYHGPGPDNLQNVRTWQLSGSVEHRLTAQFLVPCGTTYYWRVSATDGKSDWVSATNHYCTASCSSPPPPTPTPSPSRLPAVPFPTTSSGFWEFVWHCQDAYCWVADPPGKTVQPPGVTYSTMRGDCDDFAVMIAGYAQDYWSYDSFVAHLEPLHADIGHAVAGVRVPSMDTMDWYYSICSGMWPYMTVDGQLYLPIDMDRCPGWLFGTDFTFAWQQEWTWWVGQVRGQPRDSQPGGANPSAGAAGSSL